MKNRHLFLQIILFITCLIQISSLVLAVDMDMTNTDYKNYLANVDNKMYPDYEIIISGYDYSNSDMKNIQIIDSLSGEKALQTEDSGFVEWEVEVPEAGLYNIEMKYYPIQGKGGIIERELRINGELPFQGAKFLEFSRVWHDKYPYRTDNQGNQIRPPQAEIPIWQTKVFTDSLGYTKNGFRFYFKKGRNIIRLVSRREPVAIAYLKIFNQKQSLSYNEVSAQYQEKDIEKANDVSIKIQGEDAIYRSSKTLYARYDRSDPTVEPYHPAEIRLNTIGGPSWNLAGQWISWKVEVPEDGLYKLGIKAKQNVRSGTFTNRRIYINGEIPFKEVEAVQFYYSNFYHMYIPGTEDKPYLFHLKKGENTIKLEAVLGDFADMITTSNEVLYQLSTIYRRVVMVTGRRPDPMRTYELESRIPGLVDNLKEQSALLKQLALDLEAYTGGAGDHVALLNRLSHQLALYAKRPDDRLPRSLKDFRENIGALGTWIITTTEQPLQIDYLMLASPDNKLPRVEPSVGAVLEHEAKSFGSSFTHDYTKVGDVYEGDNSKRRTLKVWIGGGRDQAQTLKTMIEDTFTPESGIQVNLELIQEGVILPATLAGKGPDVALSVSPAVPINFYIRDAIIDLTQFDDFPEVASRFKHSALVPFKFRDSVFALPEQQVFPVLFYRKDILNEMGLEVPQTWEEVYKIMAELQKNNMDFGIPYTQQIMIAMGGIGQATTGAGSITANLGVTNMLIFLYQNGGELYKVDGIETNLDSEKAIDAFTKWTELYELYNTPLDYNYANYFRMGEMPLMINGYTMRNQMEVFAPELRGKWSFTLMPGTRQSDGSIDRTVPPMGYNTTNMGPSSIIMKKAKDKEAAWEFIKWWTSTDTQVRFGRELESIMGTAARYATANVEALKQLPWRLEELGVLLDQWEWVKGLPEVPGGYMVGRHLNNAFRRVIYDHDPPRETLLDYNRRINREIENKRREFNLETDFTKLPDKYKKFYWNEEIQ